MPQTIETFSLEELKTAHPEVYAKIHERWKETCADGNTVWGDETIDSLKAVVKACGGQLDEWDISPYGNSHVYVKGISDDKDRAWFLRNVLKPNGYVKKNGHADFPGHCIFTGYCADDNFLEAVWKSLQKGDTLKEALEGLASDAQRMLEEDVEQSQEEDSMLANWGDNRYTESGVHVS
jgi:hypothetical protein